MKEIAKMIIIPLLALMFFSNFSFGMADGYSMCPTMGKTFSFYLKTNKLNIGDIGVYNYYERTVQHRIVDIKNDYYIFKPDYSNTQYEIIKKEDVIAKLLYNFELETCSEQYIEKESEHDCYNTVEINDNYYTINCDLFDKFEDDLYD